MKKEFLGCKNITHYEVSGKTKKNIYEPITYITKVLFNDPKLTLVSILRD